MATKSEVLKAHLKNWLAARKDRKRRGELVAMISSAVLIHPKSVPRSMRRLQMRGPTGRRLGRPRLYGPDVVAALKDLWELAHEACGENLHPMIGEYVDALTRAREWHHGEAATSKLRAMSEGAVKKRVGSFRRSRIVSHGKGSTKPGAIHALIPVRSGPWDEAPAGTMQVDTVAHCGATLAGDFAYTVNATDVATLWGVRRAQWNKGKAATVRSMTSMGSDAPYGISEWHPDSGSEFINWHCKKWCDDRGTRLTRSRPNRKNDNCFVEERNGHVVRAYVGYARIDSREAVSALNDLYDVLTPYLNHFIASKRTVSKERVGARWKVGREKKGLTPYRRVLLRGDVTEEVKRKIRAEHEGLNLLMLKREIDRRTKVLFDVIKRHGTPGSS